MSDRWKILGEIAAERTRQHKKWGVQHWPDGTEKDDWTIELAQTAKELCNDRHRLGQLTWWDILREEYLEAGAEDEWKYLREELIQVAAVCVAWIQDGDDRDSKG